MTYRGILKNLSLDWITRKPEVTLQLEARAEDIEKLKDKPLSVELKQWRKKRSLDSNAYYWQLLTKLSESLGESKDYMHNYILRKYGQIEIIDGLVTECKDVGIETIPPEELERMMQAYDKKHTAK